MCQPTSSVFRSCDKLCFKHKMGGYKPQETFVYFYNGSWGIGRDWWFSTLLLYRNMDVACCVVIVLMVRKLLFVDRAYRDVKGFIQDFNKCYVCICWSSSWDYYEVDYTPSYNCNVVEEWMIFINISCCRFCRKSIIIVRKFYDLNNKFGF